MFHHKNSNTVLYIDRMKDNEEGIASVATAAAATAKKKL